MQANVHFLQCVNFLYWALIKCTIFDLMIRQDQLVFDHYFSQ